MMKPDLFPFDLDGVTVLGEREIEHEGRVWTAGRAQTVGQWALRPGWLRQGAQTDLSAEAEVWLAGGEILEPSVGPAWAGLPYVPTPAYVREQVIRRRAGLPLRERQWVEIRPNPGRRPPPS
ncbi:MAG: hypothetical protein IT305_24135 [Chloroflexi bacterium]|nr:hypothetical protein [Chloroflexota bacterium]